MQSNNWTDHFTSRPDNTDGNKNTIIYIKAWAQDKAHAMKMDVLTNDANHNIICLHSFVKLGGTLLPPNANTGCLIGNG